MYEPCSDEEKDYLDYLMKKYCKRLDTKKD
jgi:hypothetical protein